MLRNHLFLRFFYLLLTLRANLPVNGSSSTSSSSSGKAAGSGGGRNSYHYGSTTRHSYSLSTFSPNGDIDQIVRAMRASMLGLPLLALSVAPQSLLKDKANCEDDDLGMDYHHHISSSLTINRNDDADNTSASLPTSSIQSTISRSSQDCKGGIIYLCLPQRYLSASPLCIDSGTPHILQLTSSICLSHTGISADGRALMDYAIELALDYRYIYGVEMPVQELLMGLADKMMEMTRRAGWRPYGCALLVMALGDGDNYDDDDDERPTMYRVDPSGVVVLLTPRPPRRGVRNSIISQSDDGSESIAIDEQETRRKSGNIERNSPLSSAVFLGNWDAILSRHEMDDIRESLERRASFMSEEDIQKMLVNVLGREIFPGDATSATIVSGRSSGGGLESTCRTPMLFASFTHEKGLQLSRIAEACG